MTIIGHIIKTKIYTFTDGRYSFHTAFQDSGLKAVVTTFRSRMDTWPSLTATKKGIEYKLLLGATDHEIKEWINARPNKRVLKVENI